MKSTGIVRKIDELGRVVLPKELRNTMGIQSGDSLEIFTEEGGQIILRKLSSGCVFCGEARDISVFKGLNVCSKCRELVGEK